MEIRRGGKSYTADTVEELQTSYPGAELWLICGGDMLESLPDWYKSGWLTKNLGFAVYSRTGARIPALKSLRRNILAATE
jgi:nicotinate-nucleotide adenylyltransferase